MKLTEYVTGKICVPGVSECDILEVAKQNSQAEQEWRITMKKLGLVGGMGPESTIPYYHDIVYGVQNRIGGDFSRI